jgi:hypothetical protein
MVSHGENSLLLKYITSSFFPSIALTRFDPLRSRSLKELPGFNQSILASSKTLIMLFGFFSTHFGNL